MKMTLQTSRDINASAEDNVTLVGCHDPAFVAWARRMKNTKSSPGRRDGAVTDYQLAMESLEESIRQVLAQSVNLNALRILRHCGRGFRNRWEIGYRELDAVINVDEQPAWAVEIKFRENGKKALCGYSQLDRSLGLLHQRWPNVNGLFVSFWMSIYGENCEAPQYLTPVSEMLQVIQLPPVQCAARICVDIRELLALAQSKGLWSESQTAKLISLREAAINPLSRLQPMQAIAGGLNSLHQLFSGLQLQPAEALA